MTHGNYIKATRTKLKVRRFAVVSSRQHAVALTEATMDHVEKAIHALALAFCDVKLWAFEGYLLAERRYQMTQPAEPPARENVQPNPAS